MVLPLAGGAGTAADPLVQANLPIPPETGSIVVAAVTSAALGTALDLTAYVEKFITVQNDSAGPLYVNFGDGTQSIDDTAVTGTSMAVFIASYDSQPFFLRAGGKTHMQAKLASGATAGKVRIYVSSAQPISVE